METRRRLRITRATIALDTIAGKRTIVTLPVETILTLLPGSAYSDKMVNVLWDGHAVEMFAIDLAMRGVEIRARAATT
jgi:ABC-type transport system involved in cytochrome c biogenesis permease subunit